MGARTPQAVRLGRLRPPRGLVAALPALRLVAFVAAVALVAAMGVVAVRSVRFGNLTWWLLGPALAGALVWWALLARSWAILASGRANRGDVAMWCRTQPLRYLPGGIWAPTSRVVLVGGTAVDRLATVAAENVVSLCAALGLGGLALALGGRPAWALVALAPVAPFLAVPWLRTRTRLDHPRL